MMGLFNVYTRSGDALTAVATNVAADDDRQAIAKSQSAAGSYFAFDASIPEATLEALLAARQWPHDVAATVLTAGATFTATVSATQDGTSGRVLEGSAQLTVMTVNPQTNMKVGQYVRPTAADAGKYRGGRIVSIDSATAVTLDQPLLPKGAPFGDAGVTKNFEVVEDLR
jgi:hypothetical protein